MIEKKIEHLHRWGNALFIPASRRMLDDLLARHENPTEFIQIPVYSLS
jgi:hypothetical protein